MPELLTITEAATYLKVSRTTIYRLMLDGVLRWVRIEGVKGRRFDPADLRLLLSEGVSEDVRGF
jgi:excisionase family DNA binding protein